MIKKRYRFAGIEFEIMLPEEYAYIDDYILAPFRVTQVIDPHRFWFSLTETLSPPENPCITIQPGFRVYEANGWTVRYIGSVEQSWEYAYMRVAQRGMEHRIELKKEKFQEIIGIKTILNSLTFEHLITQAEGFLLHSSYVQWQGKGILFTAPSGTGKSTQAALWERHRGAEVLNGDRAAVRAVEHDVFAYGVPFSGSSQICKNRMLPLAAIVYLKQSAATSIRRLRGAEAFRRVWEGCSINTWDKEDVAKASDTLQRVLLSVPVFELACTPDESAVEALEGAMMA